MSELEIRMLIAEHASLNLICAQIWLAITSAFVVTAHVAGNDLEPKLRKLVIFLYLIFSFSPVFAWLHALLQSYELAEQLQSLGVEYTKNSAVQVMGAVNAVLQILGFLVGTIAAVAYFLSRRPNEST